MPNEMNKDDALFLALEKQKKQRRRKVLITVLVLLALAAVAVFIAVTTLRTRVRERFSTSTEQVLSAQAQTGTLSTVVSGSGVLEEVDLEAITVPDGVEILELLVDAQETVAQGQLLATVDDSTVITAMAALQEELETLDSQIRSAADDKVDSYIRAGVSGRVVAIYGEKDESVASCMVDHGALAVISLDGFLAVDIGASLDQGQTVTVELPDGTRKEGRVDAAASGTATVLLSDDGPRPGDTVTVLVGEEAAGTGELYVHEPLAITGYTGTIQTVSVRENQKVSRNTSLFTLTDTATSAQYDTLLRSRREQEETLLELLAIRRSGGVAAPFAGAVQTLDYDETLAPTAVLTLSPSKEMVILLSVDESDILSLEEGQEAEISIPSLGDDSFFGSVTAIDLAYADTGVFSAEVTFPKEADMLPGMTADVTVHISGKKDTLLLPLDAIQRSRDRTFVYTTYDTETKEFGGEMDVVTGITGSTQVEILEGLEEGTTVWYIKQQTFLDFFSNMTGMDMSAMGGSGSNNRSPQTQGGQMPGGMPQGVPAQGYSGK